MKTLTLLTGLKPVLVLVAAIGCFSCKKDSNITPSAGAKLSLAVKADRSPVTPNTATGITWTEAIGNVAKFEFEAQKDGLKTQLETKGLTNVNLFDLTPSFVNTSISSGTYREIEVKLVFLRSTSSIIPLTLKGNFTAPEGPVPVEVRLNDDLMIKSEMHNVIVSDTTDLRAIVVLHLNSVLIGIALTELGNATRTGGKIIISAESNTNLYQLIRQNVAVISSGELEGGHHTGDDNDSHHGSGHH